MQFQPHNVTSSKSIAALRDFLKRSLRRILMKVAGGSIPRFNRTFCYVDVAINHLKIWQSPIAE